MIDFWLNEGFCRRTDGQTNEWTNRHLWMWSPFCDWKNPRGPEKRNGALNVSCSEVCPQFSVDLRLFCLRGQRPFAFPLSMSPYGRKSDKNWPTGSKNKNLSFSKINLVRFWRALKRQVFDKKRHFFDIFGFPPTGYFTFWPKNLKKWPPQNFGSQIEFWLYVYGPEPFKIW